MGHLFLDIETYQGRKSEESSTNPYIPEAKVLLIVYNYYDTKNPPIKKEIKPPVILTEWKSGEKAMLEGFFAALTDIRKNDKHFMMHGFNILKFDLPYLFGRMNTHKIDDDKTLRSVLFENKCIDMTQLSAIISDESRRKEHLWEMGKTELNKFFDLQKEEGSSDKISRLYDNNDYDEIISQCKNEFHLEQMLNAFYLYVNRLVEGDLE